MIHLRNWLVAHSLNIVAIFVIIWLLHHQSKMAVVLNLCPITDNTPPSINEMFHI